MLGKLEQAENFEFLLVEQVDVKTSKNRDQLALIKKRFRMIGDDTIKIIVLHHNLVPSPGKKSQSFIGRAGLLLEAIGYVGIDLILAGHVHTAYSKIIAPENTPAYTSILASAGTSISKRRRGTPNSYNLIQISCKNELDVIIRQFDGRAFFNHKHSRFIKINHLWQKKTAG